MSPIRLVTFDVTNTIVRVLGGVGHNYAKVASLYDVKLDPARIDAIFPTVFKQFSKKYPNFGVHDGLTPNKWWNMVVHEHFQQCGSDDKDVDTIAQHLYAHFSTNQGWELIPEVKTTLSQLNEYGIKLGVISNFDERLETILTQLAVRHYFQFVITSVDVRMAKPSKEIFQMALKMADVHPDEALHIGDNINNDYDGAKSAGMHALLFRSSTKDLPGHVAKEDVVSHLSDVLKHLNM